MAEEFVSVEEKTGIKWLDGKDIYRKTFYIHYPESNAYVTDLPSAEIDNIVHYIVRTGGGAPYVNPVNGYYPGYGYICITSFDLSSEFLQIGHKSNAWEGYFYVTVDYTKTGETSGG